MAHAPHLLPLLAFGSLLASCASPEIAGVFPVADTYVDELLPDRNFGSEAQLVVGDATPWEPSSARILLEFDLGELPADPRQIREVVLLAFQDEAAPVFGFQTCDVHACTSAWNADEVTWDSDVRFDEKIWATAVVEEANYHDWVEWDVTDLVLAQVAGRVPNLGWMIKASNEGTTAARRARFRNGESAKASSKPTRLRARIWPLLWDIETLEQRRAVTTRVSGLVPGELVHLYLSLAGEGSTSLDELSVPVALDQPIALGTGTADANGELRFDVVAPPGTAGKTVWLQAVSGKLRSNVAAPEVR